MIRKLRIENFKSIPKLEMELGRVNVLIGENGCGKSNILEAIAFAAASSQDKLGNEYLAARGIRVTDPQFMFAAFGETDVTISSIVVNVAHVDGATTNCQIGATNYEDPSQPQWIDSGLQVDRAQQIDYILRQLEATDQQLPVLKDVLERLLAFPWEKFDFYIFSPENSALRTFQAEGQILPLGIRGEGLFAYLKNLGSSAHRHVQDEITQHLSLIDWFERFDVPTDLAPFERSIAIVDRHLTEGSRFDQRSANEGFLFLLFYFTLFIGPGTPKIFAIDNVDASLNPKLCAELMKQLIALAKKHDKQVIFTTHNPAVLDGLDLHDDEQRLFVISRNQDGHTKARRVAPPKPLDNDLPVKLSEAFLRGALGGLPKNF
ncbi:MAG: AAA family ATPase [Polyangiaceae bacterium]|nr:AAA family ATPase [Polyangiaceae bacterium]